MFQKRRAYNTGNNWSKNEEAILLDFLKNNPFSLVKLREIFPNRSDASLRSKTRKLRIKHDIFGETYRDMKMVFTEKYAKILKPRNVFEAYCGAGHQSLIWANNCDKLFSCDKDKFKISQFNDTLMNDGFSKYNDSSDWINYRKDNHNVFFKCGDAIDAAIDVRVNKIKIDILDLDTCGSTLPLLPQLLNIIKPKFLFITHGEFHSLRFGRDDVLRRVLFHRDVNISCLDLSIDQLSNELDKAVKIAALRAHNESKDSYWAELIDEQWLGSKYHGMLRRIYKIENSPITSDCLNSLIRN